MTTNTESKNLSVECGQTFSISLESMPGSTGYNWNLSMLEKGVLLVGIETQQHMSGTCGHLVQIYHFQAAVKGKCSIEFELVRPWQPAAPGRTIVYVVEVTGAATGDSLKAAMGQYAAQVVAGDVCAAPTMYYGIMPGQMQSAVMKYGIPTATLKYGIDPAGQRYGYPYPINVRYAAPQRYQDGCAALPYGVMPNDGCC